MNKNSGHIREALRRYYPGQEYSLLHEVAKGTGFSANRHLDCVVMSLWPSRGLHLSGIEIKVNKYDWKKEKADPTKAEEIAQFLDYFFIACPVGMIPIEDLPEAWGLIEVDDKGLARQKKAALKTPSVPITHAFMAALLRAATRSMTKDEMDVKLDAARIRLEQDYKDRVKREAERISANNSKHSENWRNLIMALGQDPESLYNQHEVIRAVQAVMKSGVISVWGGLETLKKSLKDAHKNVSDAFDAIGIEERKL